MKRTITTTLSVCFLLLLHTHAFSMNRHELKEKVAAMTQAQKEERAAELQERVKEIKALDISALSKEERKALRYELKDIKRETKAIGHGGIYISLVGILVIILVLILIL